MNPSQVTETAPVVALRHKEDHNRIQHKIVAEYEYSPSSETAKRDAIEFVVDQIRSQQVFETENEGYESIGIHENTEALIAAVNGDWEPIKARLLDEIREGPVAKHLMARDEQWRSKKKAFNNLVASL